jgi:hypothetical protein
MVVKLWKGLLAVGGLALLLPSLALIACSDSATEPAGRSFPIATVVAQSYSGLRAARNEIIRDGDAWTRVWDEIHETVSPTPALPPVDFGEEMLLLAALGNRPDGCYSVKIVAIEERDNRLQAAVEETVAGANCACGGALTQPVHVVRLPVTSGPVDFVARRITKRCS